MATATHASPMGLDQLNTTLYVFSGTGAGFNTIQAAVDFARIHTGGMGEIVVVYGHPDGENIGAITGGTATILILDERHGADQRWTWNGANYVPQTFTQLGDVSAPAIYAAHGIFTSNAGTSRLGLQMSSLASPIMNIWTGPSKGYLDSFGADTGTYGEIHLRCYNSDGGAGGAQLNVTTSGVDAPIGLSVAGSAVRTFANTPNATAQVYPGAGLGVSTGSAWGASIDPATLQHILTLTTTGSSGPATLVGATLNIPQYSGGAGMVFPAAGIGVSTGSAWGASIDPATIPRLGTDNTFTGTNTFIVGENGVRIISPSGSGGNAGFGMGPDGGDAWFLLATGTITTPNQWVLYNPTSGKTPLVVNDHGGISFIEGRAATVFGWNNDPDYAGSPPDTGLSRLSPGVVAIGNGNAGDSSGNIFATRGFFGAVSCPSLTTQTITSPGDLLLQPEATTGRIVIGAGGWAYTDAPSGQGSLTLINGSTDSPNITFYYGNNQNFSIDTAFGPPAGIFEPCSGQALRFIRQADEAGGAVVACMDLAGNFAIKGSMGADGQVTSHGLIALSPGDGDTLTGAPASSLRAVWGNGGVNGFIDATGPDDLNFGNIVFRVASSVPDTIREVFSMTSLDVQCTVPLIVNGDTEMEANLHVVGTISAGTKTFAIAHPFDEKKELIHACLEGPENGVFYRGETLTLEGRAEVSLPAYFEALTYTDDRSVLLTQLIYRDGQKLSTLGASRIKEGKFTIYSSEPSVVVAWEVKAVRRIGVDGKLAVEIEKRKPLKEAA